MTLKFRLSVCLLTAALHLSLLPSAAFAQLSGTSVTPLQNRALEQNFQNLTTIPICGNGVTEAPKESCDDGGTCGDGTACKSNNECKTGTCAPKGGDGCSADCLIEYQANTNLKAEYKPAEPQPTVNYSQTAQMQNMRLVVCGDGLKDSSEACDDGNRVNGDGCSSQCLLEWVAAPITREAQVIEQKQTATAAYVTQTAELAQPKPECGNGKVETGESCDDGNRVDGDSCPADCVIKVQAVTEVSATATYQKQEQTLNYATQAQAEYTTTTRQDTNLLYKGAEYINKVPRCGDGAINTDSERCDDGNLVDGDGCSSACQLELKAVVERTANTIQPTESLATKTPGQQVFQLACGDGKHDPASEECDPKDPNDPNAARCGADCKITDLCKDFDPAKDYDGDTCTKEFCDPSSGKILGKPVGACLAADPACDPGTCTFKKPECKVSGPATATQGDKVTYVVTDSAGLTFSSFECKESAAPAAGTEATAVLVSQGDYTKATYATLTKSDTTTLSAAKRTSSAVSASGLKEGTYDTTATGDKIVSCTITGPGGVSDPCNTTLRVSECSFSCGQPNGDLNGPRSTSVGLDADCKLLKKPDAAQCFVSLDGGANAPIAETGLVDVPTDSSGLHTFDVICDTGSSKAYCKDAIEVHPVCESINVTINGADGTGLNAHTGDTVDVSVVSKGAKTCAVMVNGLKLAADASGHFPFKVENTGGLDITAVCQDGPDLKGNSMIAECPGVKIPVASIACGNKILETGEACDDGNDDATDACVSCQKAVCGDGVVLSGVEECDAGKANSDNGDCTTKCRKPACGDGFVQKSIGEQCDDGNTSPNDGCSSACAVEKCGDGLQQGNEFCDPGLAYDGKECTADCQGFIAKLELVAREKTAETPPSDEKVTPSQTPPAEAEIVTMANKKPIPAAVVAEINKEISPPAAVEKTPPSATTPPAEVTPTDSCAEQFPNKDSNEYQCCAAYGSSGAVLETRTRVKREAFGGNFECCVKGVIKPHADGKLTPEEDQACLCHHRPEVPFCMSCLGPQQVGDLQACIKSASVPVSVTTDSGKVIFTTERFKASTNLCECPSPQSASSSFTCTSQKDFGAFFETPVGFSCLHPEQVDYFRKNGLEILDDPVGYRMNLSLPEEVCKRLGGEVQTAATDVLAEDVAKPSQEMATLNESLRERASREELAEQLKAGTTKLEEQTGVVLEETGTPDRGVRRVSCKILRPACLCEGPQDEPTTQPTSPETPVTTTPASEPSLKIAVCRWNDDHAILLDSGEEIPLKDACPALTIKAFTSSESYSLYQVVSRYYSKPNSEHLAEVRAAILAELNNTKAGEPIISTSSLALPAAEDGASLTAVDLAAVRDQFAVKKNIEMRDDGTLKIKDAKALLAIAPGSSAALTAEIVSPARLFKNASEGTSTAVAGSNVLVVGTDAAAATGGLGGCSLIR